MYPLPLLLNMSLLSAEDEQEQAFVASISLDISKYFAISWEHVVSESAKDPLLNRLSAQIQTGFPSSLKELDPVLYPFFRIRDSLFVGEGVLMYNDRVIIPETLRTGIPDILHSAHQGVSCMESRANSLLKLYSLLS